MCDAVFNEFNGVEYTTPRQFRTLVGPLLCPPCEMPEHEDECLCPVDVSFALTHAGIIYTCEYGMCYTISHPTA